MRSDRFSWFVIAVAGLVLATACGDRSSADGEAGVQRPADRPQAVSTTSGPGGAPPTTVDTGSAPPTTATAPTVTQVAATGPAVDDVAGITPGDPRATVTPSRGPAGTRVRLEGSGFTDEQYQHEGGTLWLGLIEGGCALYAEAEHDIQVSADGHLSGSFVVPAKGICRNSTGGEVSIGAGRFHVNYQCTACRLGVFTVILPGESMEEPTGTACEEVVVFGRGGDVAADIVADGLSCAEAESFLRAHAGPTGAENGAAHIEAEGFSCDRTGQSDVHLPRSNYKCTRSSQSIWFIRT